MTRAEWAQELRLLMVKRRRASWEFAWLLVRGRMEGLADADFGNAAEATGYSRTHLYNLFRVGLAFPPGKAHMDLPFAVHRELLREPDDGARDLVFAYAIEQRWTQEDAVRHFTGEPPSPRPVSAHPKSKASRKYYVGAHVECPNCHSVFPVREHKTAAPKGEPDAVAPEVPEAERAPDE